MLCIGSDAPASAATVLAIIQQPSLFQACPIKLSAAAAIELGVAWAGTVAVNFGWVTTVALPIYPALSTSAMPYGLDAKASAIPSMLVPNNDRLVTSPTLAEGLYNNWSR